MLSQPLGYFIHERCWHLGRREIGASNLEKNLDLFLITVHRTIDEVLENKSWGDAEGYLCNEVLAKYPVDEFMKDPQRYMQEWTDKLNHRYLVPRRLIHRDPMNTPELRTMISEATNRGPMTQFSGDLELLRLPLDIQWLIANTLEDPQEISSLLIAFRWRLPDGYWRARFGKELAGVVFEFEHLVHNIDWRYLYYGTLKLMEMSHGLRNRKRILENLKLMRRVFWVLMEEHEQQKNA